MCNLIVDILLDIRKYIFCAIIRHGKLHLNQKLHEGNKYRLMSHYMLIFQHYFEHSNLFKPHKPISKFVVINFQD